MDAREMDATIAEWMGWTYDEHDDVWTGNDWIGRSLPSFSESLDLMAIVEAVVRERELEDEYVHALLALVSGRAVILRECLDKPNWTTWAVLDSELFALATATAAQRAEALVRMIRGMEEPT